MSGTVNKVILVGNLGAAPELGATKANKPFCTVRLATTKKSKTRESSTEWHRVILWDRLSEIAGQYLSKGSKIYIEGRLQTRKWQGKDGQDRYTTEIVANEMQMLGGLAPRNENAAPERQRPISTVTEEEFDDDLPF